MIQWDGICCLPWSGVRWFFQTPRKSDTIASLSLSYDSRIWVLVSSISFSFCLTMVGSVAYFRATIVANSSISMLGWLARRSSLMQTISSFDSSPLFYWVLYHYLWEVRAYFVSGYVWFLVVEECLDRGVYRLLFVVFFAFADDLAFVELARPCNVIHHMY